MKKPIIITLTIMLIISMCGCPKHDKAVSLNTVDMVEESTVHIKAVGDNLIHSDLLKYAKQSDGTYNFDPMYENIKDYIQDADISIVNQESAIVTDNKRVSGYPAFGTPSSICDTLINVGFDVILQANNHVADKEESGFENTISAWKGYKNVTYLGIHDSKEDADKIRFIKVNSMKIAMLNFTYGVNRETWPIPGKEYMIDILDKDKIENSLARASKISDISIVFLHIGEEYHTTPSENQINWINHCIDSGAQIVICAHPHVIQPYKIVTTPRGNKGLVFYSLGNFISGQKKFETLLGGVADITLKKELSADGKPQISVVNYGLEPIITHVEKKQKICTVYKLRDYTDELAAASDIAKSKKGYSTQMIWDLYNSVVNNASEN